MLDPQELVPTMEEIMEVHDCSRETVSKQLADGTETINPVFLVKSLLYDEGMTPKLTVNIVNANFNEWEEKHAFTTQAAKRLIEKREIPVIVSMSSEAWMSVKSEKDANGIQPRHAANRSETMVIMTVALDQKGFIQSMEINRTPGNIIIPGKWIDPVQLQPGWAALPYSIIRYFFESFVQEMN